MKHFLSGIGPVLLLSSHVFSQNCPQAHLIDTPGATFSCGDTKIVNSSGSTGKIWAQPCFRYVNGVSGAKQYANAYKFEIKEAGNQYLRRIVRSSYCLLLSNWATNPTLCGGWFYNVRVRASFDGGGTWCPYGPACPMEIQNDQPANGDVGNGDHGPFCSEPGQENGGHLRSLSEMEDDAPFNIWPNPTIGGEVFISINDLDEEQGIATVDVFDLFGKQVMSGELPVEDGEVNSSITLNEDLANGLYFVSVTCSGEVRTKRLMVQR